MANYNVQEMTSHYIALAQNDPNQYQAIRDDILQTIDDWRIKTNPRRLDNTPVTENKYSNATHQILRDWFDEIEATAKMMQDDDENAQTAFDETCSTLSEAIQELNKANALEKGRKKFSRMFKGTVLTDINYIKDPEEEDADGDEADEEEENKAVEREFLGTAILSKYGPKKTAAELIEEIQDRVREGKTMTAEDIAMVIAARQIANSKPGDKSLLKSTYINPMVLKDRADKLLASEPFREFLKENSNPDNEGEFTFDTKDLTDGHGGKLEKLLAAHLQSRPDVKQLNSDLYKRYQRPSREIYRTYDAFIQAGKKDFLKGGAGRITANDKEAAVHAARMLAAFQLKSQGKVYNKAYFDRKAAEVYRSPQFQFIYKHDPNKLNLLTTGDFTGFADVVNEKMEEFKNVDYDSDERKAERKNISEKITDWMSRGAIYGTAEQRRQSDGYDRAMRMFEEQYRFLGQRYIDKPEALKDLEAAMAGNTLGRKRGPQQYTLADKRPLTEQNLEDLFSSASILKNELSSRDPEEDPNAASLHEELEKVSELGYAYFKPPVFKDGDGKTAAQKLVEYKAEYKAKFQEAAIKFADQFNAVYKGEKPESLLDMEYAMTGNAVGKSRSNQYAIKDNRPLTEQNVKDMLASSRKMIKNLNKYEGNPDADKLKEELEKVVRTGETYNNPPVFRDKKGKTAAQQLTEYKTKCAEKFRTAAIKFSKKYADLKTKDHDSRKKDLDKSLGGKADYIKRGLKDTAKQTQVKKDGLYTEMARDEYLAKRGPKYRAMVNAAKEYNAAENELGEKDPAKTMKLIDSIIDYQKGKEKLTGTAGDRFNNSMMLLANATMGTSLEKYLDEQIAKVNRARGAREGDKNFVTRRTYFDGFEADKPVDQREDGKMKFIDDEGGGRLMNL